MEIYLLRHAIAEDAPPGRPDSERALTSEGRDKLRRVLKRARQAEVAPTLILTSPYRRALQTAEIAAEALGYQGRLVHSQALVPDASPHDLWDEVRTHRGERAILLASHEPLMSSAAAFLLGCPGLQVEMKKAGLVRIDCDRFGAEARGVLKWLLTPAVV
ncbi:MAG TPA: phosphohistidine phosphatase SixA [Bryobacteraceae bacterium]|nr:phosphohistidine phosphatase SixA [Bryobacteraceae bacterium]HUB83127.1 phosphohistidine phosphatase SixA [Bryobacteraceae bacterium]